MLVLLEMMLAIVEGETPRRSGSSLMVNPFEYIIVLKVISLFICILGNELKLYYA